MDQFEQDIQLLLSSISEDVPELFRGPVVDWIYGRYGLIGGWQVQVTFLLQVSSERIFVLFGDNRYREDEKCLLVVDPKRAQTCFWFEGSLDAFRLSRSKKSVVAETDERRYLNGDPYIDYQYHRYVITLTGDIRK